MSIIRRGFYLILGFTFPGFWAIHASGYAAFLYTPLQKLFGIEGSGWLSLLTASLIYLAATVIFETCYQLLKNSRPQ